MSLEPWQWGNNPGGRMSHELHPKHLPHLLKKNGKAIAVIGRKVVDNNPEGVFCLEAAKKLMTKGIYTVATPQAYGKLVQEGFKPREYQSLPELIKKIADNKYPEAETVILLGGIYYLQSQALQALKHNWHGRVLSLDPYFQPGATYSTRNVERKQREEWQQQVLTAIDQVQG